jgi:deoxyadenosine/deoxycytidine kinase
MAFIELVTADNFKEIYRRTRMVFIEGNIGSGKSTVIQRLAADSAHEDNKDQKGRCDVLYIPEPIADAQAVPARDGETVDLLKHYYADKAKYALAFQQLMLCLRQEAVGAALVPYTRSQHLPDEIVVVMERSWYADAHVFVAALFAADALTPAEVAVYDVTLRRVCGLLPTKHALVYLRTPAAVCEKRMAERARKAEAGIPLAYLKDLERYHDAWLLGADKRMRDNVVLIDGDVNFVKDEAVWGRVKARIMTVLHS